MEEGDRQQGPPDADEPAAGGALLEQRHLRARGAVLLAERQPRQKPRRQRMRTRLPRLRARRFFIVPSLIARPRIGDQLRPGPSVGRPTGGGTGTVRRRPARPPPVAERDQGGGHERGGALEEQSGAWAEGLSQAADDRVADERDARSDEVIERRDAAAKRRVGSLLELSLDGEGEHAVGHAERQEDEQLDPRARGRRRRAGW